jgi:phosphoribosylformylglycinamidine synthase
MVGLLDDVSRHVRLPFRDVGDVIALLGESRDELGATEYLRTVHGRDEGPCPEVDLDAERRLVDLLVRLAGEGVLSSAHDVSDGGLAIALAECAMVGGLGADVRLDPALRLSSLLFGETTGRVVLSFRPQDEGRIRSAAAELGVPLAVVGSVGGARLRISAGGRAALDEDVARLRDLWTSAFERAIESGEVL